jgi:curved DNA-binding protein CbpA
MDQRLMDHYRTLGVRRDATADEIRRAYHRLALRSHPDVASSSTADMAAVNEAWHTLGDPVRRATYDAETRAASYVETSTAPFRGSAYDAEPDLGDGGPGRPALVVLITAMAVMAALVLLLIVLIGFAEGATAASASLR